MRAIRLPVIFASLLLTCGATAYAAPAGRVLIAVGDTTALRNGVTVKLARGSEVQSGDTLRVGEASNMQVRFTDESITALRANTVYRIDDYRFEDKTNTGNSFFSLLKGGMRAITGLIGRYNRDNYAVKTTVATIGIRGTHFALAQCSNDCFEKDGSKAADGLFGGVTDGRIAINNQAGEKEFGKNEFFYVAGANALPKALLAPPSFLRDQLEGQAKSKESKPAAGTAASEGSESAATPAEQRASAAPPAQPADTTQATPPIQTTPQTGSTVTQYIPAEQGVVQTAVSDGLISTGLAAGQTFPYSFDLAMARTETSVSSSGTGTSTFTYSSSEAWREQGVITILDPARLQQDKEPFFVPLVVKRTSALTFLTNASDPISITTDFHPPAAGTNCTFRDCIGAADGMVNVTWSKTAAVDTGSAALAGNLSWGRYMTYSSENVVSGTYAGLSSSHTAYEHWANGDPVNFVALPASGTYSYTWMGGTSPTDQNGKVGTMISGGTIGLTFTGAGGAEMTLVGAAWSMPSGNSYTLNIPNTTVNITQTPYAVTTAGWNDTGTRTVISPISSPVGCAGTCTGATFTATVSPMLFGANAEGLAAGIATVPANNAVGGERTASVQVYKR